MPQTSQVMGFNTEYGPKLCEGRMWALRAEGKSNIKWVKLEIFLIHYIWGIWMGLIIELILGYKKTTELMGYTDRLWGALFTRFSDKDIWEVGKKRGHCNGTHAPLIRQYLEMSNRCVWVCESAVCVNHLCVCVFAPLQKKVFPKCTGFGDEAGSAKPDVGANVGVSSTCFRDVLYFLYALTLYMYIYIYILLYITVHI